MERRLILLLLLVFLMTSCAQNGFQEPLADVKDAPAITTYSPPKPIIRKVDNRQVVEGASQVSDFKLNIDGTKATSTLKGTFTFQAENGHRLEVPFDVSGTIDSEDYTSFMKPTNTEELKKLDLDSGAKMTCLTLDCTESFVDIYVNHKGIIYHHQVEAKGSDIDSTGENTAREAAPATPSVRKVEDPKVKEPSSEVQKPKGQTPQTQQTKPKETEQTPDPEASVNEEESSPVENDVDDEAEAGTYVGEIQRDIKVLFPEVPAKDNGQAGPVKNEELKKDDKSADKNTDKNTNKNSDKIADKKVDPAKGNGVDAKEPKKETPTQSSTGSNMMKVIIKGLGQAITGPGKKNFVKGRLENPANIFEYEQSAAQPGFHIIRPNRKTYYGTDDMLAVLSHLGRYSQSKLNGYTVSVGDISARTGGKLNGHSSHQMGLDADIAYYFKGSEKEKGLADAVKSGKSISSFMGDEQWEMFEALVAQGNVDRIFVHPVIKKELCRIASKKNDLKSLESQRPAFEALRTLRPDKKLGHDDHFHLRLKCSTAQPRCRQMSPPPKATGC